MSMGAIGMNLQIDKGCDCGSVNEYRENMNERAREEGRDGWGGG